MGKVCKGCVGKGGAAPAKAANTFSKYMPAGQGADKAYGPLVPFVGKLYASDIQYRGKLGDLQRYSPVGERRERRYALLNDPISMLRDPLQNLPMKAPPYTIDDEMERKRKRRAYY